MSAPDPEGWISPRLHGWLSGLGTALLYIGPMLAGLADFGWAVLPVFLLLFLAWVFVTHPGQRPAPGRVLVLAALVLVCMALGRGIGGVLGSLPPLPAWLPILLSAAALPLAWAFRPAADEDEGDG